MKKNRLVVFLAFVMISGLGLFTVIEESWADWKVITEHEIELANLSARVYPGYFDALSRLTTLFTVPSIDFDNNTRNYRMLRYWGGSPDSALGEVPFSRSGCDAAFYHNASTGQCVLAFRGTTAQFQDLLEDFELLLHAPSGLFGTYTQFTEADKIVQRLISDYGPSILGKLEFTGHSLGGALAQAMGLKYGLRATCFNSVGLPDEALDAINVDMDAAFWVKVQKLVHINVSGDPMSDWNWAQDPYSFWDTLPRYGKNYWLPAKYTTPGLRLRNHYYNVIVHQMDRNDMMELGDSILSPSDY